MPCVKVLSIHSISSRGAESFYRNESQRQLAALDITHYTAYAQSKLDQVSSLLRDRAGLRYLEVSVDPQPIVSRGACVWRQEAERVTAYLHMSSYDLLIAVVEEQTITCHLTAILKGQHGGGGGEDVHVRFL